MPGQHRARPRSSLVRSGRNARLRSFKAHRPAEEKAPPVTADTRAPAHEWAAPGIYPVAPGVHRAPLPLPNDRLRAVNVYVIEADDGLVLIDSGWALEAAHRALTSALAALGA